MQERKEFLKDYIHARKNLSRTRESSKKYDPRRKESLEKKRIFYNYKIDEIVANWNDYESCPAKKWYRAMKGLTKTMSELRGF